jgi:hypothetical protein
MQSHSPKRCSRARARAYVHNADTGPGVGSYMLQRVQSLSTSCFVLHARGSLISHWWHGEAHSLVLWDLSPRGRGMATANTGVNCQDPPPPPPPLGMRAHEKHTTHFPHTRLKGEGTGPLLHGGWSCCLERSASGRQDGAPPPRSHLHAPPSANAIRTCYA